MWCVLDCFTQSRAFPQTTPPSLCILHTLSTKQKHPSHLEHNLEAEVPSRGLHKNPTPGQHPAVGHTRTHPYRIYRAPVRLWRGCTEPCFCLRLLSSSLVSLSCHSLVTRFCLGVTRFCLVGDYASSVVGRNNERARASLPRSSLLSPSLVVCVLLSLISQARDRARAPSFRLAVCHPITGTRLKISSYREASIKLSDPLSLIATDLKRPHHSTCRSPRSRRSRAVAGPRTGPGLQIGQKGQGSAALSPLIRRRLAD